MASTRPVIEYYFSFISLWSYVGSRRFEALVRATNAEVIYKPVDLMRVFSVSGGLPVKQRAPQRQAYRLLEMERWATIRGISLVKHPKFYPADPSLAHRVLLVAVEDHHQQQQKGEIAGSEKRLFEFAHRALQTVWADEGNIADPETIVRVATEAGLDGQGLLERVTKGGEESQRLAEREAALTEEAIDLRVFGAPTYVYRGEPFWGQDRLEMLQDVITRSRREDGARKALALPVNLDK